MKTKKFKESKMYATWEDVPHVALRDALLKMEWFNGTIELRDHSYGGEFVKKDFVPNDPKEYPNKLIVEETFHDDNKDINILVEVKSGHQPFKNEGRYEITLVYPNTSQHGSSNSIEGALERILTALDEGRLQAAKEIEEIKKQKEEEKTRQEDLISLSNKLGVELTYLNKYTNLMRYGKRNAIYQMQFEKKEDQEKGEKKLYSISDICGLYTEKEIQQLIKLVGGNPRAAAIRLTRNVK